MNLPAHWRNAARRKIAAVRGALGRPARAVALKLSAFLRGTYYGIPRPAWLPRSMGWSLGPASLHDGVQVTIVLLGQRFVFQPVTFGAYRGHRYHGRLFPDERLLASRMAALDLPVSLANILAAVSSLEGGFDSIQTYDRAKFSWGFLQFAAIGGLPVLLGRIKVASPDLFRAHFGPAGIDVESGRIVVAPDGKKHTGFAALNLLHDLPRLWRPFLSASEESAVQDAQIWTACEHYYSRIMGHRVYFGDDDLTLEQACAGDDFARAVVFDLAVHRGIGHAARRFTEAVRASGIQRPEELGRALARVEASEPGSRSRWETLRQVTPGRTDP